MVLQQPLPPVFPGDRQGGLTGEGEVLGDRGTVILGWPLWTDGKSWVAGLLQLTRVACPAIFEPSQGLTRIVKQLTNAYHVLSLSCRLMPSLHLAIPSGHCGYPQFTDEDASKKSE